MGESPEKTPEKREDRTMWGKWRSHFPHIVLLSFAMRAFFSGFMG